VSTAKASVSYFRVFSWLALGKIIACILDKTSLFFRRRASTTLLDLIVMDRASAGELSGSLSKESEGISITSAKNKRKHLR
jgi:hypothetical protein